jgi:hypothetical protein
MSMPLSQAIVLEFALAHIPVDGFMISPGPIPTGGFMKEVY